MIIFNPFYVALYGHVEYSVARRAACRQSVRHPNAISETPPPVIAERYVVDSCCYICGKLSAEGRADTAVAARLRYAWTKFRELAPFLMS